MENLRQLVESCRVLETLAIQVKRSRGSYEEYIRYQTIGLLSRLRHLDLKLDTYKSLRYNRWTDEDVQSSGGPSFSEFDERTSSVQITPDRFARNGHIRDTFINGTLDKGLAYNICYAICFLRRQEKDNYFVVLASMKVEVTEAFKYSSTSELQDATVD